MWKQVEMKFPHLENFIAAAREIPAAKDSVHIARPLLNKCIAPTEKTRSKGAWNGMEWLCLHISIGIGWDIKNFKEETPMCKYVTKRKRRKECRYAEVKNGGRRHAALSAA